MRLRLTLEEPEPIISPPDIQEALDTWRALDSDPRLWARFDAAQFEKERVVRVEWGLIHSDGTKETAIQTIIYTLYEDGTVGVCKHTHP